MALDLVQVRWQLVRAVEANQSIEGENVRLKKEVQALKDQVSKLRAAASAQDSHAAVPSIDPRLAERIFSLVQSHVVRSRGELLKVRTQLSSELAEAAKRMQTLQKAAGKYAVLLKGQEDEIMSLEQERRRMRASLSSSQSEAAGLRAQLAAELAVKDDTILQQREEIKRLKQEARARDQELEQGRQALQRCEAEQQELQRRLADTRDEVATLRHALELSQAELQRTVESDRAEREALCAHYEELLRRAAQHSDELRERIAQLEEQVARLSGALVGNKSHFAKYVQVKAENLQLQSQLSSLHAQLPARALGAGKTAGPPP
eukprot:gene40890-49880_t